ncbi:nuclear transport factor 2 family protein [Modestobacter sp. VKM Ac-2986]|uniref:nuclear transport factor 2 family protein n=1 Tax=Modestobacter sp. VKM Ac-2986 TaxID=3004140 RepID=UPI0022AB8AE3|nr:nuclear transport factor 2 family protein [Modestobacter sp. VKM Ac-2986]MCZ2830754.1 nuclear transport factor 2 family protein [Modestobacter sp. VKM Ac-2986]
MTDTELTDLPTTVRTYLTAHEARDTGAALAAFTADAEVTDEGLTHRGTDEVRRWLGTSSAEYTFTTELTGAERLDDEHWVVTSHLEGDFPGGVVDLRYRFTLRGDRIAVLTIAP